MSLDVVRAAIAAKLGTVPGIGIVHDYERNARSAKEFLPLYTTGGKLLGWNLRRISAHETSAHIGRYHDIERWLIRGYMAIEDAEKSEIAFDALIEAIREAFRADDRLGGVVATCITDEQAGIRLEDSGPVMFAGVLCHSARLSLLTKIIR